MKDFILFLKNANFFKLKKQLQKNNISFRSNSDTEALLEACSFWGIKKTLSLISGMFAFALWDRKKKELILARDRFGIKPFYFYKNKGIRLRYLKSIKTIKT